MEKDTRLARLLEGTLSADETAQLKSEGDFELYKKIMEVSGGLQTLLPDHHDQQLTAILSGEKTVKKTTPVYKMNWFRAAAAVLLLLGLTIVYVRSGREQIVNQSQGSLAVTLPDASEVSLAQNAELRFNRASWPVRRSLELEGEAFFSVAKGREFTVSTTAGQVKVLGTKFNVNNRNNGLEVECYEGSVAISSGSSKVVIRAFQSARLINNRLTTDSMYISEPAWKSATLVFRSATLDGVLKELARSYHITIDNTGSAPQNNQEFTGVLPAGNLEVAMDIIGKAFSVQFGKISGGKYRVAY